MKKQLNVNKEYVLHYFENKGAKSRDEIEKAFALFDSLEYTGKDVTDAHMVAMGRCHLPRTLGESIEEFEQSERMRETLGDHICDYLLTEKRQEWNDYCTSITDWEKRKYYAGF